MDIATPLEMVSPMSLCRLLESFSPCVKSAQRDQILLENRNMSHVVESTNDAIIHLYFHHAKANDLARSIGPYEDFTSILLVYAKPIPV